MAKNQALLEQLTAVGGKCYAIGSVTPRWREHFHPHWERFQRAKRQSDPDNLLTPGQGIF